MVKYPSRTLDRTFAALADPTRRQILAHLAHGDSRVTDLARPHDMVPLNVVDELLGGTVRVAWRKLRGYVDYERERAGSQKNWEWFQWLAEQIDRHSKARTSLTLGAHEAHRDWRP